ncbi:MAG: pantoate--beta-alanine ligase [Sphingomonadales bacterium]
MVDIIRTIADLRTKTKSWRTKGLSIALVPTMGALHEGHLSLIRLAKAKADKAVVTIFVNPTQFNQKSDLDNYPRKDAEDIELAEQAGADLIFLPSPQEIYPEGHSTTVRVGGITDSLCGATRPGHFDGVALVVTKLLLQCLPDMAIFGEKDYQQLLTIKRLVKDLDIPVDIYGAPLVRDKNGLALSSRNARLSEAGKEQALALPRLMKWTIDEVERGANIETTIERASADLLKAGFGRIDYFEIRDAENLELLDVLDRPARLFAAAHIEDVRLIDNMPLNPKSSE